MFAREPGQNIKLFSLMFLSLALMIIDYRYPYLESTRTVLNRVVWPLRWVAESPHRLSQWAKESLQTHQMLQTENIQLKETNFLQKVQLEKLAALEADNQHLRTLLNAGTSLKASFIMAEVVHLLGDPFDYRLLINKGSQEGVFMNQVVIDAEGVVGEVVEVDEYSSKVILLTDVDYGVSVQNVRSGVRAIVAGRGVSQPLALEYIASTSEFREGDLLVTSGLEGHYPPGYPVGVIEHIEHDPRQAFAYIEVKPSARFERNQPLLLIKSKRGAS